MKTEHSIPSVVIFGVGRSGTTALFEYTTKAYSLVQSSPNIFYEPLLWDVRHVPARGTFNKTSALSPAGIAAHCGAPLFLNGNRDAVLDGFVSQLGADETPFLVKFIRACGRIEYFLRKWPDARFVYIFREPCGVVNSVLSRFSFFGDEFHPSDESRFALETGRPDFQGLPYALKQLAYWRDMNEAAQRSADAHPDRILPISQEALAVDPQKTMDTIMRFCFGNDLVDRIGDVRHVWPRARHYLPTYANLTPELYEGFRNDLDWYLKVQLPVCRSGAQLKPSEIKQTVLSGWIRGLAKHTMGKTEHDEEAPRDLQTLALRTKLAGIPQNVKGAERQVDREFLLNRGSILRRLRYAYKLVIGAPIPATVAGYLARHEEQHRSSHVRVRFARRSPLLHARFYLDAVLGRPLLMSRFLQKPAAWEHYSATVLLRRGSILRRSVGGLKYLWAHDVSLDDFGLYRYIQ